MIQMKALKLVLLLGICFAVLSCQSGSKKQPKKEQKETNEFVAHLTKADTASVETLVNQFMNHVKTGKLEVAVAMLYKADTMDVWNEPLQLDNDEMNNVVKVLGSFPVLSHKIDYIKFHSPVKNEVKCTIVMREAEGEMPAVTNSWYFKPMNYLGGWRLCMMDSSAHDSAICSITEK